MKVKLIFAVLLVCCSWLSFAEDTPLVSQDELIEMARKYSTNDMLILDVRSAEEFAEGHIKNAVNISHGEMSRNFMTILEFQDKPVVVYCRSGRRANIAETILKDKGFTNVMHLEGDMNDWVDAELPVENK